MSSRKEARAVAELTTPNSINHGARHGDQVHPLMNPVILDILFNKLDLKTLKSARSTCSVWKLYADPILQIKSQITIVWDYDLEEDSVPTLSTFMEYVGAVSSDLVFYRNYVLTDWHLHSTEEEMTKFWLECGRHIRHLTMNGYWFRFLEMSYVRDVFFNWTPNMQSFHLQNVSFLDAPGYPTLDRRKRKRVAYAEIEGSSESASDEADSEHSEDDDLEAVKMEKLDITDVTNPHYNLHTLSFDPTYEHPTLPLHWANIFSAYPNLKSLCLTPIFPSDRNNYVDNLGELLVELIKFQAEHPNKLQRLTKLDIFGRRSDNADFPIKDKHYILAMKLHQKLSSLFLTLENHCDLSCSVVQSYISKHSPSVTFLDLRTEQFPFPIFPPLGIHFPVLTNLYLQMSSLATNNMEFLKQIPNLRNFNLQQQGATLRHAEAANRLISNTATLQPLESLRSLHLMANILTVDCIQKIAKWFPNLQRFSAVLTDELLWAVYKHLQNLRDLIVHSSQLTDAGITGQTPIVSGSSKTQAPMESPSKRVKLSPDEEDNFIIGIGQMKNLRRFKLTELNDPDKDDTDILTDQCIYNGFIHLKELRILSLPKTSVTKNALIHLFDQVSITSMEHCDVPIEWNGVTGRLEVKFKNSSRRHYCDCLSGQLVKEETSEM